MLKTLTLVPLDGSELSARILSFVDRMPATTHLELVLLRVLRRLAGPDMKAAKEEMHDALADLFRHADALAERGVTATPLVTRGEDPAEAVLHLVQLLRPSLVALSTHGKSGKLTEVRGGVAEQILQRCPAPLLLGNPKALPVDPGSGFVRILVPLDGSRESASVLPMVASLARRHGSEVVLLTVDNVVETPAADGGALLRPYAQQLERAGVRRVRTLTRVGDEAQEILDAVDGEAADLLALTSHSRPDPQGRYFGSVASKLVEGCGAPLLIHRIPGKESS